MGKQKSSMRMDHLYLGAGGVLAVAALVITLTFGLSSAQSCQPPQSGCPSGQWFDTGMCSCRSSDSGGGTYNQTTCPSGMTGTPPNCVSATCPSGYTGTPPNCTLATCPSGYTGTPPNCTAPPVTVSCPNGTTASTMDQCPKCPDGTYIPMGGCPTTPPPGGCSGTAITCTSGASYCENGIWKCPTTGGTTGCTGTPMTCSSGTAFCENNAWRCPTSGGCPSQMPTTACPSGQVYMCSNNVWVCQTSGTTPPPTGGTCPSQMPVTSCPAGYVCNNGAWTCPSTTTPPPAGTTGQTCGVSSCPSNPSAPRWCDGVTATFDPRDCGCARNEPCRVGTVTTQPPPTGCTGTPMTCSSGTAFCENNAWRCPTSGGCPSQMPTTACPSGGAYYCQNNVWVCPSTTMPPPSTGDMGTCTSSGGVWCATSGMTSTGVQGGYCKREPGPCPTAGQTGMRTCGPNEQPTQTNPCVKEGYYQPGMQPGMPQGEMRPAAEFMQPGQCPPEMQSCPDQWDPTGTRTVCMPKKMFWDPATNKNIPEGKDATCADFQKPAQGPMMGPMTGPMMGPMTGQMPFFGEAQKGKMGEQGMQQPMNPCEYNPNDPFCKAGFNFGDMQKQYQFDESQFNVSQFEVRNVKQELKNLKREAKDWNRDAKDVRRQLKEIGRETSGFACPTAVEVSALATEFENSVATVNALTESSSTEDIQRGLAMRDYVNGRYDPETGEQIMGLRQQLYGGPADPDTGEPTMGKMQGLNVCREISGIIKGACQTAKQVNKEYERFKKSKAPESVLKIFATVVPELQARCNNPLDVLVKAGVSFSELSQPWQPDPDLCENYMMMGPGPMGGPMMGPGPMGGPMMGPGQMGPNMQFDMPPEMMELMKQKMQEQYNDNGGYGNPYGASVLTAQLEGELDEEDELFVEKRPGGPREVPDECKPPVQRYLGFESLMRQLDQIRFEADKHFGNMNACNMFEMAQASFEGAEDGFGGPPPEVKPYIQAGLKACKEGDTAKVEAIKKKMLSFRGPQGAGQQMGIGSMVDIDQLIEDKLAEKLADLNIAGDEGDKSLAKKLKEAEARLAELQSKLDQAQKTILALNERLSDMAAKVAAAIDVSDKAASALGNLGKLPSEEVQNLVASNIGDIASLADQVKDVVPAASDILVDATVNTLLQSPPSTQVVEEIKSAFQVIESYAESGATKKEIEAKVKDELATVAVLNASDVTSKIEEGIVGYTDAANLSDWYAVPALQAKDAGLASKDLTEIKPGEPETLAAAFVRACRLGGIEFTEVKTPEDASKIDMEKELPGLPYWARGCVDALQEKGEDIALRPPLSLASQVDRGTVAEVFTKVLDLPVPAGDEMKVNLTADVSATSPEAPYVAAMRATGCMDTTDGTHFSPDVTFNRAQNMLVSICLKEYVGAGEEPVKGSALEEPLDAEEELIEEGEDEIFLEEGEEEFEDFEGEEF